MHTLYLRDGDDFLTEDRRAIKEFLYLSEIEAFLKLNHIGFNEYPL
ncbi:hypothetical protein GO003_012230 [Methylicorpusculum oleiharenae]|nr:hypothetical protein [Methylicorpusculum oleiharenae]MCD2451159.1 hypothetical protein [Methylicorpusculum oleiharenae]